jgi:hypothetical protein
MMHTSNIGKHGRKLRRLLRIHEQHYARMYADREASGLGALIRERERIERELEAAATEARGLEGHSAAHTALQAAALISTRDGSGTRPTVILALVEVAGAA